MIFSHPTTTIRWTTAFSFRGRRDLFCSGALRAPNQQSGGETPLLTRDRPPSTKIAPKLSANGGAGDKRAGHDASNNGAQRRPPPRAIIPPRAVIPVAVRIISGIAVTAVCDRKPESDSHGNARFRPRSRSEGEPTDCQTDQKKLFPIHIEPSLKLIIEHNLRRKVTENYSDETAP